MRRRFAAFAALLLASCGGSPPALQVGDVGYAEEELLGLTFARREALAELTGLALAVARGTADSLGRPLVERWRRERLAQLLEAERLLDSLGVGEDALRARYETDPDLELTVRHLLVFSERYETEATRAQARTKAERALERILAGEDFPKVAAEVSEEPGAQSREGLLQPGREGSWVPEFWNAALALPVGGISPVVETQYGFHVLRLEGREPVPFEEARNRVLLDVAAMLGSGGDEVSPGGPPAGLSLARADELAGRLHDPAAREGDTVAVWDAGALTVGGLRDHLATLEWGPYRSATDAGGARALEPLVAEAAAWIDLERRARERGLEVGPAAETEIARRWSDTWGAWARTFGFEAGSGEEQVKGAALAALSATGQNSALAREAVHGRSALFRRAFPLAFAAPAEGETSAGGTP